MGHATELTVARVVAGSHLSWPAVRQSSGMPGGRSSGPSSSHACSPRSAARRMALGSDAIARFLPHLRPARWCEHRPVSGRARWCEEPAGSGRDRRREEMRGKSPAQGEAGELAAARRGEGTHRRYERGGEVEGVASPRRCVEV
ncbi:hypothetical protein PR202_gb19183 [Eleusine coracana subsp. coracana]|uniref:Uncharacterized protein n=1 Tax=Eleusine coracana subsp. coracana TaxID=191504 RepID=A0AAV5F7D8_ELECO|nr:hypothetical protein PR202_gb19183 [Eleusine coracana subsp. coracana]